MAAHTVCCASKRINKQHMFCGGSKDDQYSYAYFLQYVLPSRKLRIMFRRVFPLILLLVVLNRSLQTAAAVCVCLCFVSVYVWLLRYYYPSLRCVRTRSYGGCWRLFCTRNSGVLRVISSYEHRRAESADITTTIINTRRMVSPSLEP